MRIGGEKDEALGKALRDEQAIERVAVVRRKEGHPGRVFAVTGSSSKPLGSSACRTAAGSASSLPIETLIAISQMDAALTTAS